MHKLEKDMEKAVNGKSNLGIFTEKDSHRLRAARKEKVKVHPGADLPVIREGPCTCVKGVSGGLMSSNRVEPRSDFFVSIWQ